MSAGEKIARLDRLVAIRQLREDLDRVTLQRATAALEEVDAAQRAAQTAVREARVAGRAALDAGERGDWIMADAQGRGGGLEQVAARRPAGRASDGGCLRRWSVSSTAGGSASR